MVEIGLCMENEEELAQVRFLIEEYLKIRSCCFEIKPFLGIKRLAEKLQDEKIDLLFAEPASGQSEQKSWEMLEKKKGMKLVLLTENQEKQGQIFGRRPFAFLERKRISRELPEVMDRFFWKEHYLKRERIILNIKGRQVVIPIRNLMYLERDKRLTFLVLSDGRRESSALELSALQDVIGRDDFLRCHNRYVINLNFVSEFRRNEFCLFNGKDVPISRRYLDEVRRRFKIWADSIW